MAAQEVERSSGKKRRSIFSGKLRTVTIILCLIFSAGGLIFWIIAINNDNTHIDKIMGAIFTFLVLICAFFTIPVFSGSEEFQMPASTRINDPSAPPQVPSPTNPANNAAPGGQNAAPHTTQLDPQPPSGNAPGIDQPLSPPSNSALTSTFSTDEGSLMDENELLKRLKVCKEGTFSGIVRCILPPDGWLSSEYASVEKRADELISWALSPDGPGLAELQRCYEQAVPTGKKRFRRPGSTCCSSHPATTVNRTQNTTRNFRQSICRRIAHPGELVDLLGTTHSAGRSPAFCP